MKTTNTVLASFALAAFTVTAQPVLAEGTKPGFRIDRENFQKLDPASQQRVLEIGARWEAISNMDRSDLAKADRKELRAEVKALKAEAKTYNKDGTVVYLSTGAIIIIILLLILIL